MPLPVGCAASRIWPAAGVTAMHSRHHSHARRMGPPDETEGWGFAGSATQVRAADSDAPNVPGAVAVDGSALRRTIATAKRPHYSLRPDRPSLIPRKLQGDPDARVERAAPACRDRKSTRLNS